MTKQVRAAKEVILCGGAINSPQLLMLSGIGNADHLKEVGVPVIQHLPAVDQTLICTFSTCAESPLHCTMLLGKSLFAISVSDA